MNSSRRYSLAAASVIALIIGAAAALPAPTLPGLHNPRLPALARELSPKAVRILLFGRFLPQWLEQYRKGTIPQHDRLEPSSRNLLDIRTYAREGIAVVVTPFLWTKPGDSLPQDGSPEWERTIEIFAEVIRLFGTDIRYLTLDNEPTFERTAEDLALGQDGTSRALRFYTALAARAQAEKRRSALSNLVIVSPGMYAIEQYADGSIDASLKSTLAPLLAWACTNADIEAIDIHAHVRSAAVLTDILRYMKGLTAKPVLLNEWSQTPAAHEWLDRPLSGSYRSAYDIPRMTPRQFITACYTNRVPLKQWNDLIALAPFDPDFMRESYAVACEYGVRVILYPHAQWGSTEFDPNEILASRTVILRENGMPERNHLFFDRLREIIQRYEADTVAR